MKVLAGKPTQTLGKPEGRESRACSSARPRPHGCSPSCLTRRSPFTGPRATGLTPGWGTRAAEPADCRISGRGSPGLVSRTRRAGGALPPSTPEPGWLQVAHGFIARGASQRPGSWAYRAAGSRSRERGLPEPAGPAPRSSGPRASRHLQQRRSLSGKAGRSRPQHQAQLRSSKSFSRPEQLARSQPPRASQ